jgi:hypothetical protein
MELDIDVASPSGGAPAAAAESAFASIRREAVAGTEARSSDPAGPEGSSSHEAAEVPTPTAEPAGSGSWTFSPTPPAPSGTQLSSAALDDAVRAGVRATVAEGRTRGDPLKQVLGGVTQHDIELGLIPGGEFVTLTRDAVRTSVAPTVGHALLEFQIDGAGILASVHVLDASSNRTPWDQVAAGIAKAARAHVTRVPSGVRGFALTLEVTSAMKTVSGSTPTDGTLTKVLRAISDPFDTAIDGTVPAQRVVAARVADAHVL